MTAADQGTLHFVCPKCQKPLKTSASMAGTRSRCPFCHTSLDVPRHSRSRTPGEDYPLRQETDGPVAEEPAYILVVCPVCHARMRPEESQIGQKVVCPDCGTPTIVPQPAEKPAKKPRPSAVDVGEYPLASETSRASGAAPAADQNYVPVLCPLCHTRMLATADQVGSQMVCPDCGTPALVPPMPPPKRKIDVMEGADEGYALVGWDEIRSKERPMPTALSRPVVEEPPELPELEKPGKPKRPVLPDRPFLEGTFSFPFHPGVRLRTTMLAAWSALPVAAILGSYGLIANEDPASWFESAMLMVAAMIFGAMWLVVAAANVMAVFRDTSEGCDEIVNWPGHVFLDWLGEPLHLFYGLCVSMMPGAAAAWALAKCGIPIETLAPLLAGASLFFTFPIVLMSMLESNSSLGVVSLPVLRTLATDGAAWMGFYAAAAGLAAAVLSVNWVAFHCGKVVGAIGGGVVQAIAWFVYFRLLGRLAWCCADRAAREECETEMDDEDANGDFGEEDRSMPTSE